MKTQSPCCVTSVQNSANLCSALLLMALMAIGASGLTACSPGCSTRESSGRSTPAPTSSGHPSLQFDYKKASELLISKSDPQSGDRWSARVVRDGSPSLDNENLWTIEMGPDSITQSDRRGNGLFILHLLDTARTLSMKPEPLSGTPESFGLNPPWFTLRWKIAASSSGPASEHELRMGAPVKSSDGSFEGLYAALGTDLSQIYVARGAMLKMLEMISSFTYLRLQPLATFTEDDVDELEINHNGKKLLYAQREGDFWTDVNHKKIEADIDAYLKKVVHHRILRFVDSETEQRKWASGRPARPQYTLTFKDRHGSPTVLQLTQTADKKVFATLSSRTLKSMNGQGALAIFEMYPQMLTDLASISH